MNANRGFVGAGSVQSRTASVLSRARLAPRLLFCLWPVFRSRIPSDHAKGPILPGPPLCIIAQTSPSPPELRDDCVTPAPLNRANSRPVLMAILCTITASTPMHANSAIHLSSSVLRGSRSPCLYENCVPAASPRAPWPSRAQKSVTARSFSLGRAGMLHAYWQVTMSMRIAARSIRLSANRNAKPNTADDGGKAAVRVRQTLSVILPPTVSPPCAHRDPPAGFRASDSARFAKRKSLGVRLAGGGKTSLGGWEEARPSNAVSKALLRTRCTSQM
ncbi:hypothetical protein PSPO01_02449 [Paraphaeosphaeria sporulosa]